MDNARQEMHGQPEKFSLLHHAKKLTIKNNPDAVWELLAYMDLKEAENWPIG